MEDGAEGVDIEGDADGFAKDLFGLGVVRRQHADALSFRGFTGFGQGYGGHFEEEDAEGD